MTKKCKKLDHRFARNDVGRTPDRMSQDMPEASKNMSER